MLASTIVHDDPYCRIELRNSNRTILAFSAINCPPGKFHGSRALQDVECNLVFLNCPRNSWYLDGIPGLGCNINEAAEGLKNILDSHGLLSGRIAAWGGSMGGYGAVVFGSLLNVESIVATGAELELLIPGGNSELILKTLQKRNDIVSPDVESIVASSQARISLYIGEFFYPDLVSALRVTNRHTTRITTLRDFGHPLPGYLNSCYGLEKFILHHFDSDEPFSFKNGEVGCMSDFTEYWETLHRSSLGSHQAEAEQLMEIARNSENAELRMHCHHALSMGASAARNDKRALAEAKLAVDAFPQSNFAAYRYVLALKAAGRSAKEWLEVAMAIPQIHQPDRFSDSERLLTVMVAGFVEAGWNRRGIDFLRQLTRMPDTNAASKKMLLTFINELLGKEAWEVSFDDQAQAELHDILLDRNVILAKDGNVQISGVMVFPPAREPDSYEGDGLEIEMIETGLGSPGFGKRFPAHPSAGQARFRMKLHFENHDSSLIYACWRNGRRMPLLRFERVSTKNNKSSA